MCRSFPLKVMLGVLVGVLSGCGARTDAKVEDGEMMREPFFRVLQPLPGAKLEQANAGDIAGGPFYPTGTGDTLLSRDGSVALGVSPDAAGQLQAVRWDAAGGVTPLGDWSSCTESGPAVANRDATHAMIGCYDKKGDVQSFYWTLGAQPIPVAQLPDTSLTTWVSVSEDGSSAVGNAFGQADWAFRWTPDSGVVVLFPGTATASSRDGGVIVGYQITEGRGQLVRWTLAGGTQQLPLPPSYEACSPWALSEDGSVLAGICMSGEGEGSMRQAFLWSEKFEDPLPIGSAWNVDLEVDLSADGTRAVVSAYRAHDPTDIDPFFWSETKGVVSLGRPDGFFGVSQMKISDDGSVLAGGAMMPQGELTFFRWSQSDGWTRMRAVYYAERLALGGIARDGSIVVGQSVHWARDPESPVPEAVVWDSDGVPQVIADVLSDAGFDLQGLAPGSAHVSPYDTRLVWGLGMTPEGQARSWVARLP